MARSFVVVLTAILMVGVATSQLRADFVIAEDGRPKCAVIAIGEDASAPADELARYLERIVGVSFPRSDGSPALVVRIEPELGYSVRIGTREGRNLVIAGGTPEDTWHAVYAFLHRLGCRWFMPGEIGEYVPKRPALSVESDDAPYTPTFPYRVIWYAYGNPDGDPEAMKRFGEWKCRNYLTSRDPTHGHHIIQPIHPDRYFEEHPEYYALVEGERKPTQPCTTNPDVIRITIEELLKYFRKNPKTSSYSLCMEDNNDFCECLNCKGLDLPYPSLDPGERTPVTDRMMIFYNRIAEAVAEEFPDRYISIYAYGQMIRPPLEQPVHPNIAVFFCGTFDNAHSVADPISEHRQKMLRMLTQWCELSDNVYLYEYDPIPYVYAIHTPLFDANARAMQIYEDLGINGLSFESYKSWASKFPNYYFNAQMMWNADQDPDALLRDLCQDFFGAASEPMYRYYSSMADSWAKDPTSPGWGDDNLWKMFPPGLVEDMLGHLEEAEAAELSPVERERVQMVRFAFDFTDSYLRVIPQYDTYFNLSSAADFDFDRALAAGQRCQALFDEMLVVNNDFVLAAPARSRFNRRILGIRQRWPISMQFRTQYDRVALPLEWRVRPDWDQVGTGERWFDPKYDDSDWGTASTESQWYKQGVKDGWRDMYTWGRAWFRVPEEWAGRRVEIFVGATDEQGWFYINGIPVYHHPEREEPDSWAAPCRFDVTEFIRPGERNLLAVMCYAEESMGGIWRPVFAYTPKEE